MDRRNGQNGTPRVRTRRTISSDSASQFIRFGEPFLPIRGEGQGKGALGGGDGAYAVGRDQPDAGTAVEQVVYVGRTFVGDTEDQLGERDRDGGVDRSEEVVVGQTRRLASGVE